MATQFIQTFDDIAHMRANEGRATAVGVVGGALVVGGGAVVNAGAKATSATVTVGEYGDATIHKTVLTLNAFPVTLLDASVGGGTLLYTFPKGAITILGAVGTIAETTTSTLSSTLNTGVTINYGVGSVITTTQASGTLTTTQVDILDDSNLTASATINVAGAAATKGRTSAPAVFDGTTTALVANFNVGVAGATDIDGDATTTYTGTITISWMFNGAS
jgi:hypothetical protein